MTGILHRYCDRHGRQCFVHPWPDWPGRTADRGALQGYLDLMGAQNGSLDMWANHAHLEPDLFDRMIPGNVKISLFREPFSRVMSSFGHGTPELIYGSVSMLRSNVLPDEVCGPEGTRMSALVNISTFPLLDFVLLTERYDIGLVMMRRRYGWWKRDLMYLTFKVSAGRGSASHDALQNLAAYLSQPPAELTPAARFLLEHCVQGNEARIYKMAQDRFQSQWEALGASVQQEVSDEVREFKVALARLAKCCDANIEDDYCKRLRVDNVQWVIDHRPRVETTCSSHGFV